MRLWKLSYISTATADRAAARPDAEDICAEAQGYNAHHGITGILTIHAGRFAQVLEGPESAIRALLARIMRDPRHHSVVVLADGPLVARRYADWSMAYREPKAFLSDQLDDILKQTADVTRAMKATWH